MPSTKQTKERILTSFKKVGSPIRVLFSTIVFGMGVQIPDVDVVIHYGLPDNILTYWQETALEIMVEWVVPSSTPLGLASLHAMMK